MHPLFFGVIGVSGSKRFVHLCSLDTWSSRVDWLEWPRSNQAIRSMPYFWPPLPASVLQLPSFWLSLGFSCQLHTLLIATATAVATSSRAVGITLFTAIYATAFSQRIKVKLPSYVAAAAIKAGLPPTAVASFLRSFLASEGDPLRIPGSSSAIIAAATRGRQQAFADSVRVVFIIAVPFGLVACIACLFLGDVKETMNYRVDAPVEDLHKKNEKTGANGGV